MHMCMVRSHLWLKPTVRAAAIRMLAQDWGVPHPSVAGGQMPPANGQLPQFGATERDILLRIRDGVAKQDAEPVMAALRAAGEANVVLDARVADLTQRWLRQRFDGTCKLL